MIPSTIVIAAFVAGACMGAIFMAVAVVSGEPVRRPEKKETQGKEKSI